MYMYLLHRRAFGTLSYFPLKMLIVETPYQHAKEVMSDYLGQVDFVLHLLGGEVKCLRKCFEKIQITELLRAVKIWGLL